jgi:Cu/Ag efflux protein CusF
MKALALASVFSLLGFTAEAADACRAQASEKKLAGAAMTSFMKKCERDAATACDASAKEKKLAGAAKTSFTKKCVTDAVGT